MRVGDVQTRLDGRVSIRVRRGKGGRPREVPVLPGSEAQVLGHRRRDVVLTHYLR